MPFPSPHTAREHAGSMTLEPPPAKRPRTPAEAQVSECGGNVQLMAARLDELTSSIRALLRSNRELGEALLVNAEDPDFLQAVAENELVVRRQARVVAALVEDMRARGSTVDLELDIQIIVSGVEVETNGVMESAAQMEPPGENDTATSMEEAEATGMYL